MSDLQTILDRLDSTAGAEVIQQLQSQQAKVADNLQSIRHQLLVMSGKGGVGKSTVTASLALAFARMGWKVGILDADLNGPSIPHILGLQGQGWRPSGSDTEPLVGPLGIKVASMAFFLGEDQPLRWKGPTDLSHVWLGMVEAGTIRELLGDVRWGELDLLLVDMPPGAAADKPPAILQFLPHNDGAVFVTTPSKVARSVVRRSQQYAIDLGLAILGVVENFAGLYGNTDDTASTLGQVPYNEEFAVALDSGAPLADEHAVSQCFDAIAATLMEAIG